MEFTINKDDERGIHTVGWFEPDGRMTVQVRQYVPDSFFKAVQFRRDMVEDRTAHTQDHWRPVALLPNALMDNLLVDSDGKPLAMANPDRQKKLKRILNDGEYRNLRVAGGSI